MHARRTARIRPDHVIEGRATVIERRGATPARPVAPQAPPGPDIRPINDNAAGLAPFRQPRPASPDLVFQGAARWSTRSSAPRRSTARPHVALPLPDEAARRKASVGVMVAVVATIAAWSAPDPHPPVAASAQARHSTLGAQSATTGVSRTVSGSGKGDRITLTK